MCIRDRAYRLDTAVATIGIRGTIYSVAYGNSVTVNTDQGAVEACNNGGCLVVGAGQSGYIKDIDTAPVLLGAGPQPLQDVLPPVAPKGFSAGDTPHILPPHQPPPGPSPPSTY